MSNAPKPAKIYPGTKLKEYGTDGAKVTTMRDTYKNGKGFSANITGEGSSGKAGGKMKPSQALEKGGKVCTGGEYNANGEYGKQGKGKASAFKEYK